MAMVVVMVVLVTQRNGIGEGTMEWQKKKKKHLTISGTYFLLQSHFCLSQLSRMIALNEFHR